MRPLLKGYAMNPKLTKFVVKGALGLVISAVIGYTIKMEKQVEDRIDNYFESNAD